MPGRTRAGTETAAECFGPEVFGRLGSPSVKEERTRFGATGLLHFCTRTPSLGNMASLLRLQGWGSRKGTLRCATIVWNA